MERDHYSKEWDDAPMPHSIFFTKRGHAIHGSLETHWNRMTSAAIANVRRYQPAASSDDEEHQPDHRNRLQLAAKAIVVVL